MEEDKEKLQEQQEESSGEGASTRTRVGFPRVEPKQTKSKKILFWALLAIIVILGVGGWLVLGRSRVSEPAPEQSPTPEADESTPTPTPESIERGEVRIQILNGTGIPKAASDLKEELEEIGYSQIEVGNASPQNRTTAEVTFDRDLAQAVSSEIKDKLEQVYQEVSLSQEELVDFDVEIITGYPKGYTPTPTQKPVATSTPTPTPSATGTVSPTTTITTTPTASPTPTP